MSFKKGDRLDPKNWRPISLLNVDYKIASRAIAGRLLKILHAVVDKDQTCGVPGRFIGEKVAYLRDVVDYSFPAGVPWAIISLSQEKPFDCVDWGFMRDTLFTMDFGPSFISRIDLFYRRSQSAVNVNGHISSYFSLSRGVRQGCLLSPILYVMVAEVLACYICCHPDISRLPFLVLQCLCLLFRSMLMIPRWWLRLMLPLLRPSTYMVVMSGVLGRN